MYFGVVVERTSPNRRIDTRFGSMRFHPISDGVHQRRLLGPVHTGGTRVVIPKR